MEASGRAMSSKAAVSGGSGSMSGHGKNGDGVIREGDRVVDCGRL